MRAKLRAIWRYRPRFLTIVLLTFIAALIVVANLSGDLSRRHEEVYDSPRIEFERGFDLREANRVDPDLGILGYWNLSSGWPLLWRQYVLAGWIGPSGVLGACYSKTRLGANVALWIVIFAVPGIACEWHLRAHGSRFRWNLRTMLAGVGLAAAACAWFATARNRAKLQDPIIASGATIWLEQSGPKWLDVLGAEHLCRRIVGADLRIYGDGMAGGMGADDATIEGLLRSLRRMPELQYLFIEVGRLTPALAAALGEMRQLRMLSISFGELHPNTRDLLAKALGGMRQLRMLDFAWDLSGSEGNKQERIWHGLSPIVANLKSLESLRISGIHATSDGMGRLAALPRLKCLRLHLTEAVDADLAKLPLLKSLEELEIDDDAVSTAALRTLCAVKNLNALHLVHNYAQLDPLAAVVLDGGVILRVPENEANAFRHVLEELRRSHPGIIIDDDDSSAGAGWPDAGMIPLIPKRYERLPDFLKARTTQMLHDWHAGKSKDPFQVWLKSIPSKPK